MHKHLNKLGLAGMAAALALTPAMATAQQTTAPSTPPGTTMQQTPPTAQPMPERQKSMADGEQKSMMKSWPEEQQAAFKQWPAETQSYFWSLPPERQKMFWALTDADKVKLSTMPEQQRETVWAQIEAQVAPSAS